MKLYKVKLFQGNSTELEDYLNENNKEYNLIICNQTGVINYLLIFKLKKK